MLYLSLSTGVFLGHLFTMSPDRCSRASPAATVTWAPVTPDPASKEPGFKAHPHWKFLFPSVLQRCEWICQRMRREGKGRKINCPFLLPHGHYLPPPPAARRLPEQTPQPVQRDPKGMLGKALLPWGGLPIQSKQTWTWAPVLPSASHLRPATLFLWTSVSF